MNCQPTTEQKQRRARKLKAPTQLGLFELPPAPAAQSPRAVAIAAETTMQAEAKRALAAKAGKPAAKAAKPKPTVLTS